MTIKYLNYNAFVQQLHPEYKHETYQYFDRTWNITIARYFVYRNLAKPGVVPVIAIAQSSKLDYPNEEPFKGDYQKRLDAIQAEIGLGASYPRRTIDEDWIDRAIADPTLIDLSKPIIISDHAIDSTHSFPILIDGAHRVRLAYVQGVQHLPCFMIPEHLDRILCK